MKYFSLALILFTISTSNITFAQSKLDPKTGTVQTDSIGTIILSKGQVIVIRGKDNQETRGSKNLKIFSKDILKTKDAAFVRVQMIDNTVIQLGPKSIFKFEQFDIKSPTNRKSIYNFVNGQLRTVIKNKAEPGDIIIKARSVAMGIRGTEILSEIYEDRDGVAHTKIALLSGKVNIDATNKNLKTIKTFDMGPGKLMDSRLLNDETSPEQTFKEIPEKEYKKLKQSDLYSSLDFVPFLSDIWSDKKSTPMINKEIDNEEEDVDIDRVGPKTSWQNELEKLQKVQHEYNRNYVQPLISIPKEEKKATRSIASVEEERPKCKMQEECMDYQYFNVKGQNVAICSKRKVSKYPRNCK